LVTHSREDEGVPFEEGRLLASLIPNAQFLPLESKNHLLTKQEPAWAEFVAAVRAFLSDDDG
jgi:pimeloyl-ACP methyl ester carboxylesterase